MSHFLLFHALETFADRSPEKQAVVFLREGMNYGELENRSNSLAQILVAQGLRRGDRVGIYLNKGLESTVGMYGIMKAGGAYVPLDPHAPVNRIAYVIKDCGIQHLLTNEKMSGRVRELLEGNIGLEYIIGLQGNDYLGAISMGWDEAYSESSNPVGLNLTEQDLAYILYTSGSTGSPKGIMHTHRSGLSFAEWASKEYGLLPSDRVSNHAPLHFDLSTFDYFATAIAGGTTVIIPEAYTKFPSNMSKLIEEERISVWYSVPFALMQMLERGGMEGRNFSSLRWILFAGEVFPTKHLRRLMQLLPDARYSNLYGPTETNVCTYYHVESLPESDDPIPIGRPCANIEDLVVDAVDHPAAPGEVGELLIRGGVVMKGYWGMPEKTAKGFYKRKVFGEFEDVFYRTGDLVQMDRDGNYRYLGRKDRQIKTRGYRVELDEVEVGILSHASVEEAATYPIPDLQGSNLIGAAVVPKPEKQISEEELLTYLKDLLPPYAIPAKIEIMKEFPRTSTGKINRRELQAKAGQNHTIGK